jgi:hemoglobin
VTERDLDDRASIEEMVRTFYRRAAMDDVLGPVFRAAHVDWSVHVPTLIDFWAWQLLGERGYEGNPLTAHRPAHVSTPFGTGHYERWLEIFDDTVDESFRGPRALAAKQRARKMAHALRRLLDGGYDSGDVAVGAVLTTHPDA